LAKSEKGEDSDTVIARGKAPKLGGSSRIEYQIQMASGQSVRLRSDGTADYKNQDKITTVKKDSVLAKILPPDDLPEDGYDVKGKELKAPPAGQVDVIIGENIRQEPQEDRSILLMADQDGEFRKEKGKIAVVASYTVKGNLDGKIGNIKFPGMVIIAGDVLAGFYIMATGDIKIAGAVEAALLSSEQSIIVQVGVRGANKALLRARKEIWATFVEAATMLGVGDIKVKKSILRSNVKCNSRIIMPDEGRIIGGVLRVKSGMLVGNIGNENSVPTLIIFGQDILVEDQIDVEQQAISKLQTELLGIDASMKHPDKIADKEAMQDLFANKLRIMKTLEKRNLRLFSLREQFEQHAPSEIIVRGTAFPGVVFECHGRTLEIQSPKSKFKIAFDIEHGRIVEMDLEDKK
jgi:uncharacterized protein